MLQVDLASRNKDKHDNLEDTYLFFAALSAHLRPSATAFVSLPQDHPTKVYAKGEWEAEGGLRPPSAHSLQTKTFTSYPFTFKSFI